MLDSQTEKTINSLISAARRTGARVAIIMAARKLRSLGENRAADLILFGSTDIVAEMETELDRPEESCQTTAQS